MALPVASGGAAGVALAEVPGDYLDELIPPAAVRGQVVPGPTTARTAQDRVSPWLAELIKLADRGMDDSVLLPFVANTEGTFNLTPDQIIWLSARGVSSATINAMLAHDQEIAAGVRELRATTVPAPAPLLPLPFSPPSPAASNPTPAPAGPGEMSSIVVREPSPASPGISGAAFETTAETLTPAAPAQASGQLERPAAGELYRVRLPHPVKLTDTLVVYRCEPRVPNLLIISAPQ